MKTLRELAEEWANNRCPEQGPEFIVWCMCKEDFLAGFKAGVKEAEVRILDEFFNNYGADEHASFALRVNAYQWNDEDK